LTFASSRVRLERSLEEQVGLPEETTAVRMVELTLEAVAVDWKGNPIAVLREKNGRRKVFIWIGVAEATAISWQVEGQRPPRPMTHDLMASILEHLEAELQTIAITDMQGDTYYAELQLQAAGRTVKIDCRPSDAIALALRTGASMWIGDELLDNLDSIRRQTSEATIADSGETTVH
jgi:bifunctional DNase/RNase